MTPEQYERDQDRAHCPSDEELLAELDAYGHMTWTVGDGDWVACCDFSVTVHERGVLVAYHVVVDCESGGFVDTVESNVVDADRAPFDLPSYWAGLSELCLPEDEVRETNESWNAALKKAIKEAQDSL